MGDDDVPDETDTVITPGGPRPRDRVHSVRPGEAVRTLPDGTFVIVPDDRVGPSSVEGAPADEPDDADDDEPRHDDEPPDDGAVDDHELGRDH